MRRLLGRVVALLLVTVTLQASYSWSVHSNKSEAVVHEAVEIVLQCRFSDAAYGYFIELQEPSHPDYEIVLLFETEAQEEGREYYEYRYVLFPNRAGELVLPFQALMKQTTKESIENSVIGRDNVEDLSFETTSVTLPPLHLHVKPSSAPLTGEMNLSVQTDTTTVSAYKPLHLSITLEGVGNLQQAAPFELNISNVTLFAEKPEYALELTAQGYRGRVTQHFALVSHESYTIPSIQREYWSLSKHHTEHLQSVPIPVTVTPAYRRDTLLDATSQEPAPQQEERSWLWSALALFMLGFAAGRYLRHPWIERALSQLRRLDAWLWPQHRSKASQKSHDMRRAIRHCSTPQALLVYLIISDSARYSDIIAALESETITFSAAKKEALKRTDTV